jgi:hypothetical protein
VQTIYRGLKKLNLGKCRKPVREKPGNQGSDSLEAHTVIFDSVWEDVTPSSLSASRVLFGGKGREMRSDRYSTRFYFPV